jgi:alkanesulfonate monooxygenase SsuD/methylene tetrahydromethanopterin reductase-like flavin-dependent oxidoreductase (luciferase family)
MRANLELMRALMRGEQVGEANLHPWPKTVGGPPMYIGTWASGPWLKRAAQEYDGWLASGTWTNYRTFKEALQKYRDLGGKRAIIATVYIDLKAEDSELGEDTPFNLRCTPKTAAERLQRLAEIGYDDCLLVKHGSHTEADLTEEDLQEIRSLLPNPTPQPPPSLRYSANDR